MIRQKMSLDLTDAFAALITARPACLQIRMPIRCFIK